MEILRRGLLAALLGGVAWVTLSPALEVGLLTFASRHLGLLVLFVVEWLAISWLINRGPLWMLLCMAAATAATTYWVEGGGGTVLLLESGGLEYASVLTPLVAMAISFLLPFAAALFGNPVAESNDSPRVV